MMPPKRILMADILKEVAAKHQITVANLVGQSRRYEFSRPRQEAYYRAFVECPHQSYLQIAAFMNRDHTTVLHGVRLHCKRVGLSYQTAKMMRKIGPAFCEVIKPYSTRMEVALGPCLSL